MPRSLFIGRGAGNRTRILHTRSAYTTIVLHPARSDMCYIVSAFDGKRKNVHMLVYTLTLLCAIILMIGGHYTYALMPAFNWLRDAFDLSRNYYDRIGHIAQGFVPAMIARELFIRYAVIRGRGWMNFIIVTVCTFIAVVYEFLEWWVAIAAGIAAESFLATQGDI